MNEMRLDLLIDQLLNSIARERLLLRRVARYLLPLLLLPIGFALAQMARSWLGLLAGGFGALVVLAQIELIMRPILARAEKCERVRSRLPNIIAVDFYRTGDLFKVVQHLNGLDAAR